jgi:hypothetical protein
VKVVDSLKVSLTNEGEDMCLEHLRAIRNVQLNQGVENVAARTVHFRRVYICRYEGDGVKRGWYITRYKLDVVIDVDRMYYAFGRS